MLVTHRGLLALGTMLGLALEIQAVLVSNPVGTPQELATLSPAICAHRITNGGSCSVLLDIPASCAGVTSPCPIVLMYHGHGGRNAMFPMHGQSGGTSVHDFGQIGVYPQGALYNNRSGWNDGSFGPDGGGGDKCNWDDFNCTTDPNDPVWTAAIISTVAEMGATGRWYAYGSSNGANEAQIIAANAVVHPDTLPIVGIAVHSGQMLAMPARSAPGPYNYNQPCAGTQPCTGGNHGNGMAQLSIHGTADSVIPYHGGPRFQSPTFILADEVASDAVWARQNNCTGGVHNETVQATYRGNTQTTAVHSSWVGCPAKAPVELYTVLDSPHVGCQTLRGEDVFATVFGFFAKVDVAHGGKPPPPRPPAPPPVPPPPPGPPGPPGPPPPAVCQACLLKACGPVRSNHDNCVACIAKSRMSCFHACSPYPYQKSVAWLCGAD